MYIARKYGDYRLQEIADAFGLRHYGGVSSTIHLVMRCNVSGNIEPNLSFHPAIF